MEAYKGPIIPALSAYTMKETIHLLRFILLALQSIKQFQMPDEGQ